MLLECTRRLQECSRLHTRKLYKRSRITTQTLHVHLNLSITRKLSQRFFLGLRLGKKNPYILLLMQLKPNDTLNGWSFEILTLEVSNVINFLFMSFSHLVTNEVITYDPR